MKKQKCNHNWEIKTINKKPKLKCSKCKEFWNKK